MGEPNIIKNCLYCGIELGKSTQQTTRKYCSSLCKERARQHRMYPNRPHKLWVHEQAVFGTAMELYWRGEESAAIARYLGIPEGTMYSWVHDFGSQKQRQRKTPLKNRLRLAESGEEWLEALRENIVEDSFEGLPINLVCGTFQGQSVDKFASVISERLKANPLSGDIYAFCNKMKNTITTFAWKPPVFNISKYIKMHGTFIWPHEDLGKKIEVTSAEFERVLFLKKQEKGQVIITEKTIENA